ncbi:MAG: hypothetical protein IPK28_11110 [Devosia sp.]|nr:hypothetical protein [Devosia sp.]
MFENLPERAAAKPGFLFGTKSLRAAGVSAAGFDFAAGLTSGAKDDRRCSMRAVRFETTVDRGNGSAGSKRRRRPNATNSVIRSRPKAAHLGCPQMPHRLTRQRSRGEVVAGRYAVADRQMIVPLLDRSTEPPRVVGDWTLVRDVPNARSFTKNDAKFLTELAAWVLRMSTDHAH